MKKIIDEVVADEIQAIPEKVTYQKMVPKVPIIPNNIKIQILEKLKKEFNNCCAYCRSPLGVTDAGSISHFLPKSKYPSFAYNLENLVLSCNYCSRLKGNKMPLDKNGNEIIINPKTDVYEDHIKTDNNGVLIGVTNKGINTIELFQLNRKPLIESRIKRTILNLSKDNSYAVIEQILNNTGFYNNFIESIENVKGLLLTNIENEESLKYFHAMLYANVITILETYLSDAFINTVLSKDGYLKKFVETFHDYSHEKFDYQKIFREFENIDEKVSKTMLDIIYHNISKVKGIYKDTLGIIFPNNISHIYKAVEIRHDIVHRNGKDKKSEKHSISQNDIELLINGVIEFVSNIESQLNSLK
ncbi:HNH endonuclease [Sutcliffiella horikoshii]|uniref:HNH endonuclease n=1 Tax=Sutcliffiella horikoshii TaxID=79883 RepID=UPI00203A890E|nr:HNH endonuclease [Sutcliffiella horikoshii]MCM3620334.1 HNH endonuclease [Sutcliffiella horikoshii]